MVHQMITHQIPYNPMPIASVYDILSFHGRNLEPDVLRHILIVLFHPWRIPSYERLAIPMFTSNSVQNFFFLLVLLLTL